MKKTSIALALTVALAGCAVTDASNKTFDERVSDKSNAAVSQVTAEAPPLLRTTTEPFMEFAPQKAATGNVTLKAASAPFGTLMLEIARQAGYSLVFLDGVDANHRITVAFNRAQPEEALRTMAFLAGYVAVFDKHAKTIRVAERGTYVFRLPASLVNALTADYMVGGNPSASSDKGGEESGSSGSTMQAKFEVKGKESTAPESIRKLIESVAGPNAEVSASELGLVSVTSNAQALKRVGDLIKTMSNEAMTQVDIEAAIVEVTLKDEWQFGFDWQRLFTPGANAGIAMGGGGTASTGDPLDLLNSVVSRRAFAASGVLTPTLSIGVSSRNILAAVDVMRTLGETNVISRPRIVTSNNVPATFFDGFRVPYLGSVTNTSASLTGSTQATAETSYATDGVSLSVRPAVLDDNRVQMTLVPVMNSVGSFETFKAGEGVELRVPVQTNRQSLMQVVAETGKTLVIGGIRYTVNDQNENPSFVPGLSLGRGASKQVREVVILLRADIVPAPDYDPVVGESV